jgi:hypothetical protein|tara:strand:- start:249 stop:374 length:126 start_codon:yes stop_codon:yes gene_type:complete
MSTLDVVRFFIPYAEKNDKGEVISMTFPWGFVILLILVIVS